MIANRPALAFFGVVALTLSLGVGATTVVFAVIRGALIRPLPWPHADLLVRFHHPASDRPASFPQWRTLAALDGFEDVAASALYLSRWLIGEGRDENVRVMHASSALLRLYGLRPLMGRFFTPDEDLTRRDVVVLTYETWQRRFGGRADIIGDIVMLGFASPSARQTPYAVVGVLPPEFSHVSELAELLLPTGWWHRTSRLPGERLLTVTARLAPSVSIASARARVDDVLRRHHPGETGLDVRSLAELLKGDKVAPLTTAFAASSVLLLVCCAAVAGLLLERMRQRRHELAVREALGASRARLGRRLLMEHLSLGLAGGLIGLLLASWAMPIVNARLPDGVILHGDARVDLPVGIFALSVGLITTVLFGVAPLWWMLSTPLAALLKDGGRQDGRSRFAMQRVLVALELGFAMVLVVSATLLGETLVRMTSSPLGFNARGLAMLSFRLTEWAAPPPSTGAAVTSFQLDHNAIMRVGAVSQQVMNVVHRLTAVPGVAGAASASAMPWWKPLQERTLEFDARPDLEHATARQMAVTSAFFSVMQIPLLSGRTFDPADGLGRYAIVSREFERRFLNGQAVGRRFARVDQPALGPYTIIGVVSDVRTSARVTTEGPVFYTLSAAATNHLVVRVGGEAAGMLPALRKAVKSADPRMVIHETTTMDTRLADHTATDRLRLSLSAVLGSLALVLAGVGLYGLAARMVADRKREVGIRVAMGAARKDIYRLLARDAMRMAAAGTAIGLPGAVIAAYALRSVLFGVSPLAPHVYLLCMLVLVAVSMLAVVIPARRAARVDAAAELRA